MTDRRYCVVGRDVSRSPSPAMMNAGFASLGVAARYSRVSIPEAEFARRFRRLLASGFSGMNVTIPFKTEVMSFLASLDSVATRIQAVNTVKREEDGRYTGHNTDPDGIVGAMGGLTGSLGIRSAALLGAGGAARAFCEAMNRLGCVDVGVVARRVGRARGFVVDMERAFPRLNLTLASREEAHHLGHDLIFNASPMGSGGEPLPAELRKIVPGTKLVFDAVYAPAETSLLAEARRNGAVVVRGSEMLLFQGMAALELWTGKPAPEAAMRGALERALGRALKSPRRRRQAR